MLATCAFFGDVISILLSICVWSSSSSPLLLLLLLLSLVLRLISVIPVSFLFSSTSPLSLLSLLSLLLLSLLPSSFNSSSKLKSSFKSSNILICEISLASVNAGLGDGDGNDLSITKSDPNPSNSSFVITCNFVPRNHPQLLFLNSTNAPPFLFNLRTVPDASICFRRQT